MSRLSQSKRQTICRMFARGEDMKAVADAMQMNPESVKSEFLRYLDLPLSEKLSMTLLPELVTDRVHRLADDVRDMNRIEALLADADEKALVSLLDMKRKIKERMMKDSAPSGDASAEEADPELDRALIECCEKIFGSSPQAETS